MNELIGSIVQRWGHGATQTMVTINQEIRKLNRIKYVYVFAVEQIEKQISGEPTETEQFDLQIAKGNKRETLLYIRKLRERKTLLGIREAKTDYTPQIKSLKKNALISSIKFVRGELIIKTKAIKTTYKNLDRVEKTVNMGKYRMTFRNGYRLPSITNETYPDMSHAHPCIERNGTVCMGQYSDPLTTYIRARRFDLFVSTLVLFLQNVESTNPYMNINNLIEYIDENTSNITSRRAEA